MDKSIIKETRRILAANAMDAGDIERARSISKIESEYLPILSPREIHPEEEPDLKEINMLTADAGRDLYTLGREMSLAGQNYANLMEDAMKRLEKIQEGIAVEVERIKDLNMLCGDHSEFGSVETLSFEDFEGDVQENGGVFSAVEARDSLVNLVVTDIKGNGYEGNDYVYKNKKFVSGSVDTSNRQNLTDRSFSSVYEYSRLNADKSEKSRFSLVNFDGVEAECSISLRASQLITMLRILSDSESLICTKVEVSGDGAVYRAVMDEELAFNDKESAYRSGRYVYGSGAICFPSTKYLRLSFKSDGHTDDKIAFSFLDAKA